MPFERPLATNFCPRALECQFVAGFIRHDTIFGSARGIMKGSFLEALAKLPCAHPAARTSHSRPGVLASDGGMAGCACLRSGLLSIEFVTTPDGGRRQSERGLFSNYRYWVIISTDRLTDIISANRGTPCR